MKLTILASLFVLMGLIAFSAKRQGRRQRAQEESFWARENRANSTRRKSLEHLNYILIPLETFPTHLLNENPTVMDCIQTVESLTPKKIVNLTGWSNTDLKLEYGAANINDLSEFDHNYTLLVRALQSWADELLKAGYADEAVVLMEFALSTRTDVGRTYYQLADYYVSKGRWEEIDRLIKEADSLRSVSKSSIIRHLKEKNI